MVKTSKGRVPWQPQMLVGNASLSRMAAEWFRDFRRQRRARRRESKGRWART